MKIINMMNFVRDVDPRVENSEQVLYDTTCAEFKLCREYGIENTFLLQYDALIDPGYIELFSQADEKTELGIWLEIVQPLAEAVGLPWRGRPGWKWDWHVVPGFSMAYEPEHRKAIIDECMRKFKEMYGCYPKTVGSWLLDTVTAVYLADKYNISALAICRDQVNTDAYTLVGGYFNQAYYPSRKNIFAPAQTKAMQIDVPVCRLLGPDPIHNYDNDRHLYGKHNRFLQQGEKYPGCYTMEPVWGCGAQPEIIDWFYDSYFTEESLGFAYAQIGQENSFGTVDFIPNLRMQLDKALKLKDVRFMKMCDTGEMFKQAYPLTPATSVCAMRDWNRGDEVQCINYDCARYTASLLRDCDTLTLRALYLFDENVPEHYLDKACETWDAEYENLPLIDTIRGKDVKGLTFRGALGKLSTSRTGDETLRVSWDNGSVEFAPDGITVYSAECELIFGGPGRTELKDRTLHYAYKGVHYRMTCTGDIQAILGGCVFKPVDERFTLKFR